MTPEGHVFQQINFVLDIFVEAHPLTISAK